MIRANLLPRPNSKLRLFGASLELAQIRAAGLCVAVLAAVALLTYGLELSRTMDYNARASADEQLFAAHASEREQLRALATQVAQLREIDRVANESARSGNTAALAIARIGNALPADVWLDRLDRNEHAFDVGGRSLSLGEVGLAVVALGRAMPDRDPMLLGVNGSGRSGLHFSARLSQRETP